MEFLLRFAVKVALYFLLLLVVLVLGLLDAPAFTLFWAALALAAVNTLLRPLLLLIALPFNFIMLGIASVFANLLTLVIAFAIAGVAGAFWPMLLIALAVMLADDAARIVRKAICSNKKAT
ncbi:MAG: phage holin family protein [Christensenellales bacterium]|jgi:putative membrane protein